MAPSVPSTTRSGAHPATTAGSEPQAFAGIFASLELHLTALDRFLHGQLAAFEPEIRALVEDCINSAGTRIRPALVFLSGWRGPAEISPDLVRAAAVVELVHLATVVHDDLMDETGVRRHRPTASRECGPAATILLGDALFAHGMHLAAQFPTPETCAAVTESTRRVCAGEIVHALRRRSTDLTRADYRRIADLKTAELFRVSCALGARLAGAEPGYVEAAGHFGRHLGLAHQIHDDLVAFRAGETGPARAPGTDLAGGSLTLPLLALLERLPAAEAAALRAEIAGEQPARPALRRWQMREHALLPAIAEAVEVEVAAATAALSAWPGHPPTPMLLGLAEALQAQVAGFAAAGAA